MTTFVYMTEQCREDAAQHALTEIVHRIGTQVESSQSVSSFDNFPVPYFVKKKLKGRQPRLIADLRHFGEHQVFVFMRVLMRSHHEYDQFVKDPVEYGERNFRRLVSDDELQRFVEERSTQPETSAKPTPSDEEFDYLYNALTHAGLPGSEHADEIETIVCESHLWVEQVSNPSIRRQLNLVGQCCLGLLRERVGLSDFAVPGKTGWKIWAARNGRYVLLVAIDDGVNAAAVAQRAREIAARLGPNDSESVLRESRRAYPSLVLADEDLWLKLEEESEANMALSPEETEVLLSARSLDAPFPLFINGRAGSGKSTVLQYLFADLLFAHGAKYSRTGDEGAVQTAPGVPLYLTANGELLRVARSFVGRLLATETRYLLADSDGMGADETRRNVLLERSFQEFHPFMLGLLPSEKASRFKPALRIDYPAFRRKWHERFGKDPRARRDYGPDLSWHVIRSYIKGMNSSGDFGPEDYEELPDNQITVTRETYEHVYQRVWQGWYESLCQSGYWDDQDLARLILDENLAPPAYSAVFCDEAQDFTRIEIEVLLRLCLYSNRTLPHGAVKRVPFAFAGDEFQTLNPTGFRWDAVKAAFVEKLIFELAPQLRREGAELNYHELRFNYRSTTPIVHFCNLVQAVRAARFGIHELRPQRAWASTDGAPPVLYFDAHNGEFWNVFRDAAAGYVIIVPCLEGEEADFVRDDPVLWERVPFDDEVPRNVLSAGRAKGCEYPAVIVYGFGAALDTDLVADIGAAPAEGDARRTLTLQYFVNRVYVAVSRAKRRLVIVDTQQGVERLWKPAVNEDVRERVLDRLGKKRDMWAEAVGGMSKGMTADLGTEAPPDRAAYARLFESDGKAKRDAYMMYQATTAYRDAGESARARECRAWALEYEGRTLEAGAAFAEAGLLDEARRVLWRSERHGWRKLLELAQQFPQLVTELETRWAQAIQRPPDVRAAADVIEAFDQRLHSDPAFARSVYGDPVWARAVEQSLEPLLAERGKGVPPTIAVSLLGTVERLEQHGVEVQRRLLADLCFVAEQFGRAADLWEQAGEKRSRRYLVAKARSAPYPECVDHFRVLDDQAAIVAAFDSHPGVALGDAQARAVGKALMGVGRYADALTCLGESATADSLVEIARGAIVSAPGVAERALRRSVTAAAAKGDWDLIGRLVAEPPTLIDVSSIGAAAEELLRRWVPELRLLLVRGLARSEALAETTAFAQRDAISQFLREFLRVKEGAWIGKVSLIEAGAAFERAGRFTDSLMYYEAVLRMLGDRKSDDEVTAIRRRWLAVKARQLEYEESRVPPDAATVRRVRRELESAAADWRIDPAERLPRYPILDALNSEPGERSGGTSAELRAAIKEIFRPLTASLDPLPIAPTPRKPFDPPTSLPSPMPKPQMAPAQRIELKAGELRFEVLRDQRRCLVTHLGSLETLKIEWSPPRVAGTVEVRRSGGDKEEFEVDAWNLSVWFAERQGRRVVMFRLKAEGAEVALET